MLSQTTISKSVSFSGIGLHSGKHVAVTLKPAAANTGIVFFRTDVEMKKAIVKARFDLVSDTRLGTTITNAHGVSVATIEHLMAAIWGAGLDNLIIEINAPEVPIMDGSSAPFMRILEQAGSKPLAAPRRVIRILKPIEVRDGQSFARVEPNREGDEGTVISIAVDYESDVIGKQSSHYDFREVTFKNTLASARTFGFEHEVAALQKAGLALGGSLDNAIVVGKDRVLNDGGLRFDDEFVRHKALDCIGDVFLAGLRIDGHFNFVRPGHGINNQLLRALFADELAYSVVAEGADPKSLLSRSLRPAFVSA